MGRREEGKGRRKELERGGDMLYRETFDSLPGQGRTEHLRPLTSETGRS